MALKKRKMDPVKDDWYKFCTTSLEWLNPFMNYERQDWQRYVDQLLDICLGANINTLAYMVECGGYALWNSEMVEKDRHLGDVDLFELLDEGTHKRGIKFVAAWLGFPRRYPGITYETWRRRDVQGNPTDPENTWLVTVCPNTPFGTYTAREFKEVLTQYCIDGIYLEGIWSSQDFCFCPYCQEKFRRLYGYGMLTDPEEMRESVDLCRFRTDSVTNYVRRLRNVIDEVSPNTVFTVTMYQGNDFSDIGEYADVTAMELGGVRGETGKHVQIIRAMTRKFTSAATICVSKNVDRDYAQRPSPHFKLNFVEALAYAATPQAHVQNALEADLSLLPALTEMYGAVKKVRPYLLNSDVIAYAGLYIPWQRNETLEILDIEPFNGYYQVLMEAHIPFKVISRRDLAEGNFADLQVIVLPNAVRMSDAEVEGVRRFVADGGGLVLTYKTSFEDEQGNLREEMGLADVAGVKGPFGMLTNPSYGDYPHLYEILPQHYYRVSMEHPTAPGINDKLLSYSGGLVEFEVGPDAKEIAHVLDFDYGRMHWHHTVVGWYPGERIAPLIIARENKGRVVYIGGELDRAVITQGDPASFNILANGVRWAGKAPLPFETDAPPTVELVAHRSRSMDAMVVFFINRTANPGPGWVRYVLPLNDLELKIAQSGIQPKEVFTVTGAGVGYEIVDDTICLRLSKLDEYEGVVIKG